MLETIPDVLSRIVEHKRGELRERLHTRDELERQAANCAPQRREFAAALAGRQPAVIAEIKKASPSKGLLASDFQPARLAALYEEGGAAALSVLTDERFFQGSLADLETARNGVTLPVLRKDFTLGEFHVVEAAAHGADAILLIAAILTSAELRRLRELAGRYGMASVVEVHAAGELESAIDSGAEIIGVNNRNLHTFEVTLETSLRLAGRIPAPILRVSESGIHSAHDVRRLREAGYHAFLVGERLMTSPDPAATLRSLLT